MKKRTRLLLTGTVFAAVLGLASCGGNSGVDTYKTYYTSEPTSLNYLVESNANSHQFTADSVDGLTETNRYGAFQGALAKEYSSKYDATTDTTVYTFKLHENLPWITHEGKQYVQTDGTQAVVKADDFITSAKYVLSANNGSGTYYMYTMFIEGAEKYYYASAVVGNYASADAKNEAGTYTGDTYAQRYGFKDWAEAKEIMDKDFSETVGIKAISDFEVQYTVIGNVNYFDTALNYVPFYPTNADFLQSMGTDFGNSNEYILYNGAYYISSYVKESEVVLKANPTYYDKDVVSIKNIKYTFVGSADSSTARTLFEAGEIDSFTVNRNDAAGWEKYVTGADGKGTISNPANNNTYSAQGGSAYVYSSYWNFDRENDGTTIADEISKGYTTHTEASYANTQKAIANTNFRLAYLYGYKCLDYINEMYGTGYAYLTRGFMPQGLGFDSNGKDYTKYFTEVFVEKQGIKDISVDKAYEYLYPNITDDCKDLVVNADKSKAYADAAYAELKDTVTFPVKIEIIGDTSADYFALEQEVFNAAGDYLTTSNGVKLFDFEILQPTNAAERSDRLYYYYSFDILVGMGWGPDYGDPNTYFNIIVEDGDMTDFAGLVGNQELGSKILGKYTEMVENANKKTGADRFKALAEAEYYLVYEQAIVMPFMNPSSVNVYVSEVIPYTSMRASVGLSQYKHKYTVMADHVITQEDFETVRTAFRKGGEYASELEAAIEAVKSSK